MPDYMTRTSTALASAQLINPTAYMVDLAGGAWGIGIPSPDGDTVRVLACDPDGVNADWTIAEYRYWYAPDGSREEDIPDPVNQGWAPGEWGTDAMTAGARFALTAWDDTDATVADAREVAESAVEAFWAVVASAYPQATGGDLEPGDSRAFDAAALAAVVAWLEANSPQA